MGKDWGPGAVDAGYGTYILEMGRPVAITDLARKMIDIMGAPNVQIRFIGLRPGEKLREELSGEGEQQVSTDHQMIFQLVSEKPVSGETELVNLVGEMVYHARAQEGDKALRLLKRAVPNYSPAGLPGESGTELRYPPQWTE